MLMYPDNYGQERHFNYPLSGVPIVLNYTSEITAQQNESKFRRKGSIKIAYKIAKGWYRKPYFWTSRFVNN